jgi:hypothetical protein
VSHLSDDAKRQRLLAIRKEFRRLLDADGGRPMRNTAVFYSGTSALLPAFRTWLGKRNPAFSGAINLESLPAGAYLAGLTDELKSLFGTEDFDTTRSFQLSDGASFSASINGMWRELSARYAKACSGVVHILVSQDRAHLHRASLKFWADRGGSTLLPKDLKVFGFVELPILVGMLSTNSGVTAVNIYTESGPGEFALLNDGRLVPGHRAGNT